MANGTEQLAGEYLDKLHDDQTCPPPEGADESSLSWAKSYVGAIQAFRNSQRGNEARNSAKRFGLTLAKDRYRFFWEFWQNAEDARATRLRFRVRRNELVVENNGKPFTSRDVYSVCFVASSQKEGVMGQKGQFGIGLLSLMKVCHAPEIHSGPFHFRLERDYTYPEFVDPTVNGRWTRIRAPLADNVDPEELCNELLKKLDDNEEVLLYMSHLRRVEVLDEIRGEKREIKCNVETTDTGGRAVHLGGDRWLRFSAVARPRPGLQREDGEPVPDELPVVLVRGEGTEELHRVAAFFPTDVWHGLPWKFSAPFEVTANREQLAESSYNHWLLEEVGRTMVDAACDRSVGDSRKPWRLVPPAKIREQELRPLYEAAHEKLSEIKWIPTAKGLRQPADIAIPASDEVRRLIKPGDVPDDDISRKVWVRGKPEENERELLENLGAHFFCCHELSKVLADGPDRSPDWYLRSAAEVIRLHGQLGGLDDDQLDRLVAGRCFKDWRARAFSLKDAGEAGRVVCNARTEAMAKDLAKIASQQIRVLHAVYRLLDRRGSDPLKGPRKLVHEWLIDRSDEGEFRFEPRLEPPQFIRHFVVDAEVEDLRTLDETTHDSLLSFIRDHMDAYTIHYKSDPDLSAIGEKIQVAAFTFDESGRRVSGRRSLATVYMGAAFVKSPWAVAARGVPGIWWLGAKYKKALSRESHEYGVPEFLRRSGAREGPRPELVKPNGYHGTYQFSFVTRGDRRRFPQFPHDKAPYGYTYGLERDYECTNLSAVLASLLRAKEPARRDRSQALLRVLEQQWESFGRHSQTQACYYYSNGRHVIDKVPTSWLCELRSTAWLRFADRRYASPEGRFARTRDVETVLGSRDPNLCSWDTANAETAQALGLRVVVPASEIIARLRAAYATNADLTERQAKRYYEALSKAMEEDSEVLESLESEALIYCPTEGRKWWTADLCLQSNRRLVFGAYRAFLTHYREAHQLWSFIGVEEEPGIENLKRYWREVSEDGTPGQDDLARLERSYQLANKMVKELDETCAILVWTDRGWKPSDTVVATEDEGLWAALGDKSVPRWLQSWPWAFAALCRWSSMTLIEKSLLWGTPNESGSINDEQSAVLKEALSEYTSYLSTVDPGLFKLVRLLLKAASKLEVIRVDTLEVPVSVQLPGLGRREATVSRAALCHDGRLFLPELTEISGQEVVSAVIGPGDLTPAEIAHVRDGLRVKIMDVQHSGVRGITGGLSILEEEDEGDENIVEFKSAREGRVKQEPRASEGPRVPPPAAPAEAIPVEDYEIESDEKGDGAAGVGRQLSPGTVVLRKPGATRPSRKPVAPKRSTQEVEERGVDFLVEKVLEPERIRVSDQRIRPRVGADLVCSDGVFRELKTFSGRAPNRLQLSLHERARASDAAEKYQLVIVENLFADDAPTITIISDPMANLDWQAIGAIVLTGWRDKAPHFRVIRLRTSKNSGG